MYLPAEVIFMKKIFLFLFCLNLIIRASFGYEIRQKEQVYYDWNSIANEREQSLSIPVPTPTKTGAVYGSDNGRLVSYVNEYKEGATTSLLACQIAIGGTLSYQGNHRFYGEDIRNIKSSKIIEVKKPTCIDNGWMTIVCQEKGCQGTAKIILMATSHNKKLNGNLSDDTSHYYKCDRCNETIQEEHKYDNKNICSICRHERIDDTLGRKYTVTITTNFPNGGRLVVDCDEGLKSGSEVKISVMNGSQIYVEVDENEGYKFNGFEVKSGKCEIDGAVITVYGNIILEAKLLNLYSAESGEHTHIKGIYLGSDEQYDYYSCTFEGCKEEIREYRNFNQDNFHQHDWKFIKSEELNEYIHGKSDMKPNHYFSANNIDKMFAIGEEIMFEGELCQLEYVRFDLYRCDCGKEEKRNYKKEYKGFDERFDIDGVIFIDDAGNTVRNDDVKLNTHYNSSRWETDKFYIKEWKNTKYLSELGTFYGTVSINSTCPDGCRKTYYISGPRPEDNDELFGSAKIVSVRDLKWKDYFMEGSELDANKAFCIPSSDTTILQDMGEYKQPIKMGYAVEFEVTTTGIDLENSELKIQPKIYIGEDEYLLSDDKNIDDKFKNPIIIDKDSDGTGSFMEKSENLEDKIEIINGNKIYKNAILWRWVYYLPADAKIAENNDLVQEIIVAFDIELLENGNKVKDVVVNSQKVGLTSWNGKAFKYSLKENLLDDIYSNAQN